MKTLNAALVAVGLSFSLGSVVAADAPAKGKDGMMKHDMTMQECKDHMTMAKKDGMKKDDAMMKKDSMCADMMKKDGGMMKKDEMKK